MNQIQNIKLTKSDFILFRKCPEELWLLKNRPELTPPMTDDDLHSIEQGNKVDGLARQLFQDEDFIAAQGITSEHVYFQKEVVANMLVTKPDILVKEPEGTWRLYEAKATTKVEGEYIDDITFQQIVLEKAGYSISRSYLVHVNKDYVLNGAIDPTQLLTLTETTEQVKENLDSAKADLVRAISYVKGPEPEKSIPLHCKKKRDCPFFKLHYPDFPEYSVFEISRIRGKKLTHLLDAGIYDILDVPEDYKLTLTQRTQVDVAQSGKPLIKPNAISEELANLEYPLYFLDYESFSYVIPVQNGAWPYQHFVFQYSLHIQEQEGAELQHYEYLLDSKEEPVTNLIEHLQQYLDALKGTIIVWHASFEKGRHKDLGKMYPEHALYFEALNERIFDLETVFTKQLFVHPDFRGKTSIKNILPVLAPEYDYSSMEISNGLVATLRWHHMTDGRFDQSKARQTFMDLLEYCQMDTLAMVKVFESLKEKVNQN